MEYLALAVENEKESNCRLVEYRAEVDFIGPQHTGRRLDPGQIIKFEHDVLVVIRYSIDERRDLRHGHAPSAVENDISNRLFLLPLRQILVIGEVHLALVAVDDVEPDVAGVSN